MRVSPTAGRGHLWGGACLTAIALMCALASIAFDAPIIGTFYSRFRHYLRAAGLAPTGIHVLRHTAAKLRRDAGESIENVSAFLDHSSLAVTTVYLRRLEGQDDRAWRQVAEAIGV